MFILKVLNRPFCILRRHRSNFLNYDLFLFMNIALIALILTNTVDIMRNFISVFTVFKSTCLQVSSIKRLKVHWTLRLYRNMIRPFHTSDRRQSKPLLTIDERGSKIARNTVFD